MNVQKNPKGAQQPKQRARVHNRDRHAEILAAAQKVFTEHGFEAATTAQIARLADVAEGTIYRYASTKRDLLEQVIEGWYAELSDLMKDGIARCPDTKSKLAFAVEHQYMVFSDQSAVAQLMVREMRAKVVGQRERIDALNRAYTRTLIDVLIEGQKAGVIREDLSLSLARDIFFGTIEHAAMSQISRKDAKARIDAFSREYWSLVSV